MPEPRSNPAALFGCLAVLAILIASGLGIYHFYYSAQYRQPARNGNRFTVEAADSRWIDTGMFIKAGDEIIAESEGPFELALDNDTQEARLIENQVFRASFTLVDFLHNGKYRNVLLQPNQTKIYFRVTEKLPRQVSFIISPIQNYESLKKEIGR
jgi:hypothetical protein